MAFLILTICTTLGLKSSEHYAAGFKYGSIALVLFGALIVAGNSLRTAIPEPNLLIPTRREHHESVSEHFQMRNSGLLFFLITLVAGALLFLTGFVIKLLSQWKGITLLLQATAKRHAAPEQPVPETLCVSGTPELSWSARTLTIGSLARWFALGNNPFEQKFPRVPPGTIQLNSRVKRIERG
jgi:hypothetical protein